MRRVPFLALGALALTIGGVHRATSQVPEPGPGEATHVAGPETRFPPFAVITRGAKEHDGFFHLYQKDETVYCEIRPDQFNVPWLCSISVARGGGMGGSMLNFNEDWVLFFKRVGDKVFLVRRNVHFKASPGTPAAKAVETTYTDSVLMALRIATINMQKQAPLINLNDIFMTDFAQLGLGVFDASRSNWNKVKAFPKNVELQVAGTFSGGRFGGFFGGGGTNIDSRGNSVVIHYGMAALPDSGYQPRLADDRVGYFLSAVKDFTHDNKETSFVRYVRRWRLERAEPLDPKNPNKLSAPKKKIVYWIEKSVPDEYRGYVREGILEWNKAFEKIGFRDAIEVRQQEDDASGDFDPEDIRYNTFRWITLDAGFAMGPSRANPLTGELIDADIIFDASMLRVWKRDHDVFKGTAAEEAVSPIREGRLGVGMLEHPLVQREMAREGWNDRPRSAAEMQDLQMKLIQQGYCQCCAQKKVEIGLGAMTLAARGVLKPGEPIPEELVGQAIKEVTMHEVGHTLGLRHNFIASTMLKNEQLHDLAVTRKQGLVGSVMDYAPINLAPKGVKQGDYFTTTIGPYDYWAIEYAYKPLSGGTEGEREKLAEIANRGALPGHDYATDEDLRLNADPLVNLWDLGSDPMKFGQDRVILAEELMKGLSDRIVDKGEGYQRARLAFSVLLAQYGNAAELVSRYVGGEHIHRDHRGDQNARDPMVPVKPAKQREALKFLQDHLLTDKPFQFPPEVLRKLGVERWNHWGTRLAAPDYPLHERILGIQRVVLEQLLDADVLRRVQENALKTDKEDKPVTVAEVFRTLTDGVWSDLNGGEAPKDAKKAIPSSIVRRNLQREHLKSLSSLVLGDKASGSSTLIIFLGGSNSSVPPDARSLARMHLRDINKRIDAALAEAVVDDTTRAHLEECRERVGKVLSASMQVNEP